MTAVTPLRGLLALEPGLLTTVQDLGRHGWAAYGVPAAGALDEEALRLANRLVGNAEGAAALEITLVGPVLRASGALDVAVVGGSFGPAPGRCVRLEDGEVVSFAAASGRGARHPRRVGRNRRSRRSREPLHVPLGALRRIPGPAPPARGFSRRGGRRRRPRCAARR